MEPLPPLDPAALERSRAEIRALFHERLDQIERRCPMAAHPEHHAALMDTLVATMLDALGEVEVRCTLLAHAFVRERAGMTQRGLRPIILNWPASPGPPPPRFRPALAAGWGRWATVPGGERRPRERAEAEALAAAVRDYPAPEDAHG